VFHNYQVEKIVRLINNDRVTELVDRRRKNAKIMSVSPSIFRKLNYLWNCDLLELPVRILKPVRLFWNFLDVSKIEIVMILLIFRR